MPVHPRAGGEHRVRPGDRNVERRFIPARAGNTRSHEGSAASAAVHPRAGGEHAGDASPGVPIAGSSPRGRGTQHVGDPDFHVSRFIPARAGNTLDIIFRAPQHNGSSPRGRGTREIKRGKAIADRFIPARAGNTCRARRWRPRGAVHPRAGGEHASSSEHVPHRAGSSPRGRGTRAGDAQAHAEDRFIPARAGNTAENPVSVEFTTVHPRAGGEHAGIAVQHGIECGSSPRGRGTHLGPRQRDRQVRFIPARAGNT